MISIIVAMDKNNLIGKDGDLPWYYPEDLKYFKQTTLNKTVLMGRKTFESIINRNNKPLPKRENIVLTRNQSFTYPDVKVVHDLDFLSTYQDKEVFIIGGRDIYELCLPFADRLYITHINNEYAGDTYFPEIDYNKYKLINEDVKGDLSFCIYERV